MKRYKWLIIDFITLGIIFAIAILLVIYARFNWMWWTIFFISTYAINSIMVIFTLANNDNEYEKLSWIFFVVFVPCIGIIFYCLFRVRSPKEKEINEYENQFNKFKINEYIPNLDNNNKNEITKWQSTLNKRNFYNSNFKIFDLGLDAYNRLLEDIKNAKKYIHIEIYILKISEIYELIKHLLFEKVKQGVEVKIIFDKFGTWKVPYDEFKHLKANGVELCFFNIPIYPYVRNTDNKRLHRKFFIIDGEVVHFGGLNISDEYCSYSTKYGYWADLNFVATGQIINDYQSVFLNDWCNIKNEELDKNKYISKSNDTKGNCQILTFEEGPHIRTNNLEDSIVHWINSSFKTIKLATPYLIPTRKIMNALFNALRRGVDIHIFIPGKPDKKFTYKTTLFYSNELTKYGAKIHKLNEIFLHSKFAIFDDKFAYLGTNNLDMRSFYSNQESINLIVGNEIIKDLNKVIDKYLSFSIILDYEKNKLKRVYKKFIANLFAPLM